MSSDLKKRIKKAGQLPGTLIYTGSQTEVEPQVTLVSYNQESFNELILTHLNKNSIQAKPDLITWVHVEGLRDIAMVNSIGLDYGLHPLTIEDILNVSQRSKIEDFESYIFVTMKLLLWDPQLNETAIEQISIVIGKNYVLSFVENKSTIFNPIRDRLRAWHKQPILERGSDYLAYRLMDSTIDYYFLAIEKISEQIETLEEKIIQNPNSKNVQELYQLKHKIMLLRKAIWPIREEISHLLQADHEFITSSTRLYLRDVYDHIVQAIDTIENLRDMLASILDIYLSLVTNKLNEVMKVLTIISTLFIPISFITSLYGMNFKYMPELSWRWGYPLVLATMLLIACGMLLYFRRKKWI